MSQDSNFLPSVNFLSSKSREFADKRKQTAKVYAICTAILVVYLVILVPVVTYRLYQSNRLSNLNQNIEKTKEEIKSLYPIEAKYTLVANKLNLADLYFQTRKNPKEILTEVMAILPPSVVVNNVNFGSETETNNTSSSPEDQSGSIMITSTSPNVFSTVELIQQLEGAGTSGQFAGVTISSVTRNEEGIYNINIILNKA